MRLIDADVLYIPSEEMNARMAVAYATTVDAVPVQHGRWVVESKLQPLPWDTDPLDWDKYDEKTHSEWQDYYVCSECREEEYATKPRWHYCPNCGAKMDGKCIEECEQ